MQNRGFLSKRDIPFIIGLLFLVDLGLCVAYPIKISLWESNWFLRTKLDLDMEGTISAWYSTVQLFCIALLGGVFTWRVFN